MLSHGVISRLKYAAVARVNTRERPSLSFAWRFGGHRSEKACQAVLHSEVEVISMHARASACGRYAAVK